MNRPATRHLSSPRHRHHAQSRAFGQSHVVARTPAPATRLAGRGLGQPPLRTCCRWVWNSDSVRIPLSRSCCSLATRSWELPAPAPPPNESNDDGDPNDVGGVTWPNELGADGCLKELGAVGWLY